MVFGKVKGAFYKAFKRGHPDVYGVLKKYCDEHDINPSDVTASAVAAWLASDDEAKKDLEQAMKDRRTGGSSGSNPSAMKPAIDMFKEMCDAMGSMFKSMNEARAGMSLQSMLSDFKAVSGALTEMKKAGSEAGAGSMEDMLATVFLEKILGVKKAEKAAKTKTGEGSVKKVED